jgi:MoaA/NifB/PqqE/SkfB family radical SAM enzyme
MKDSLGRSLTLARTGITNYLFKKPMCISFEITHSCNAHCQHCHRGGDIDQVLATPAQFRERSLSLRPVVAQISGGEPLMRKDVVDIVKAVRRPDGGPYIVFVTNGALLTLDKYRELNAAGVDTYSVSLDFPDERHDEFRQVPGLFAHLKELVHEIAATGDNRINFNCVVQSRNFRDLPRVARLAHEWGAQVNFSPYTWLRTHDKKLMLSKDEIVEFKGVIAELVAFRKKHATVRTPPYFFADMVSFFETESVPDCRAGERFLVVNPDATLSPCGLIITSYPTIEAMRKGFVATNTCTSCHTCIRSNSERPVNHLVKSGVSDLLQR